MALPERGPNPQLVHRRQAASLYAAPRRYKTGNKGTGNYQGFTHLRSPAINKNVNSMTVAKQSDCAFDNARSFGEMTQTLISHQVIHCRDDQTSVLYSS